MEPVRRRTARVLPVSPRGRVLLLEGHDPARPDHPYWFTLGGGIEPGESARGAAVRELLEEVGLRVGEDELIGPVGRGRHDYRYDGVDYRSSSVFFACALGEHEVVPQGLPGEVLTSARWWDPAELQHVTLSNPRVPHLAGLAVAAVRPAP